MKEFHTLAQILLNRFEASTRTIIKRYRYPMPDKNTRNNSIWFMR